MSDFSQANRKLSLDTPLGPDQLLLIGFAGHEAISQLFSFQLDLLADNRTPVPFDQLLGQKVTVHVKLPDESRRHVNGLCARFTQGERTTLPDSNKSFTGYRMEIVPELWKLTRRSGSRIFQHMTVPDILKKVLSEYDGLAVSYEIQGVFYPRDYCVQYRETDFNFVSRLMEEEGIYYFFAHSDGSHTLVLGNTPGSHPDVPGPSSLIYDNLGGGTREEERIYDWEKTQELRSGKITLWDHSFELPYKHLEAERTTLDSVPVGSVTHRLKIGGNDGLELYDFPGEYAQRFDGIDKGGGERPSDLAHIFEDNERTVGIRMEQEELPALAVKGASNVVHLVSGHMFTLERHFNGNGAYLLTSVFHSAREGGFRSATDMFQYSNSFTCLPESLPFRPLRVTLRPFVQGLQTAVVVGASGEEIFTDKYGRVKVQFHWDREGKSNEDSSCWVRVATAWAGRQWGMIHIPRVGQEVVVAFQEGDPDQPLIVGSVYNADMMPPYTLPANKTQSGVKTRSSSGGGPSNFNELRFEDRKGHEEVLLHAERTLAVSVEGSESHSVGGSRSTTIGNDETIVVKEGNRTETLEKGNDHLTIKKGNRDCDVLEGNDTLFVQRGNVEIGAPMGAFRVTSKNVLLSGTEDVKLQCGGSSITLRPGEIELSIGASRIHMTPALIEINAPLVKVNC